MSKKLNRRAFLGRLGSVTISTVAASVVGASASADAGKAPRKTPAPSFSTNGDEDAYPNKIASYTKGLPHNERGEVDHEIRPPRRAISRRS